MKRATSLTAAAGEHYVAYRLSEMAYPVAMTRGGSPSVDIMVANLSGTTTIALQVKTSTGARRTYSRPGNADKNRWEWDVGRKALELRGDSIFYAFVDLKWSAKATPDVFLVPAVIVASFLQPDWSRYMFWIMDKDAPRYQNRWDILTERLNLHTPQEG